MTDDPADEAGTEGAQKYSAERVRVLEDVLAILQDMSGRLVRGEGVEQARLTLAGSDLNDMREKFLKEVDRHEARVFDTGGLGAAEFDLDDIRSRIGRRLDRIRDARGAG